jgi:tripartite ATP-independent transporter DctM subunit
MNVEGGNMGYISFFILIGFIFLGIPIAFSLGFLGFIGMGFMVGWDIALSQLKNVCFSETNSYVLSVVPMFVLMGNFAAAGGMSSEIFESAKKWFGRMPGGLAIGTTMSCAGFGAISGSTMASASLFTRLALPEMLKAGYDARLASGCIAAAGGLACLIPPSLLVIFYAIISGTSIGKLLIAGIMPGVITALFYSISISLVCKKYPHLASKVRRKYTLKEKVISLKGLWSVFLVFMLVIGGIYLGWFTPTEAGSIGALSTLLIGIINKKLTWKSFKESIITAGVLTAALSIIIVFGNLYSTFLTLSGVVESIPEYLLNLGVSNSLVLLGLLIMYLFLGCIIDPPSMIIITTPIVYPIAQSFGYDPVWFGIIVVMMCEIAVKTPPLGMNLYAVKLAGQEINIELKDIIQGTIFFVFVDFVVIFLLVMFPSVMMFLPNLY